MELQENPKFSMFLSGAWTALYLAVLGTMFGCLIGFGVGIVYTVPNPLESKRLKCVGIGSAKIVVGAVLVLGLGESHDSGATYKCCCFRRNMDRTGGRKRKSVSIQRFFFCDRIKVKI